MVTAGGASVEHMAHRRQFVLTREPVPGLNEWKRLDIGGYFLYIHPDLEEHHAGHAGRAMVLLGCIVDAFNTEKTISEIVNNILVDATCLDSVFLKMKHYAGSFVVLFFDRARCAIWSDARATHEVYYCASSNLVVCGSQPNLIAKLAKPEKRPSKDPALIDFFQRYLWDSRWVGDETYYDGIRHLLPNHYLDVEEMVSHRYWPNEAIGHLSLADAVSCACRYLQGSLRAIVERYRCMMAVTAGSDSRVLLAASRGITEHIHCFINDREPCADNPEVQIPKAMFASIGETFHVYGVPEEVDEHFRSEYFNSVFLACDRLLPSIYNVFYKMHSEKILILGVGEIGRTFFGSWPTRLTGHRMAYKLGYGTCPYAIRQCEKYVAEVLPAADRFGVNPMVILYWEQRLGNWGAARNSESNIAIQKIDPFNSHYLNEVFLAVEEKYRDYQQDLCILFREMVKGMWPELLEFPVNPAISVRDKVRKMLMTWGAFELLKELKYQLSYARFLLERRSRKSSMSNMEVP